MKTVKTNAHFGSGYTFTRPKESGYSRNRSRTERVKTSSLFEESLLRCKSMAGNCRFLIFEWERDHQEICFMGVASNVAEKGGEREQVETLIKEKGILGVAESAYSLCVMGGGEGIKKNGCRKTLLWWRMDRNGKTKTGQGRKRFYWIMADPRGEALYYERRECRIEVTQRSNKPITKETYQAVWGKKHSVQEGGKKGLSLWRFEAKETQKMRSTIDKSGTPMDFHTR